MSGKSNALVVLAGLGAGFVAITIILLAALMYALETPWTTSLLMGATASFPAVIAIACFLPSKRTLAIRIVGGVLCLVMTAAFASSFFVEAQKDDQKPPQRGGMVALIIASGAMALKGKWPGAAPQKDNEVQS